MYAEVSQSRHGVGLPTEVNYRPPTEPSRASPDRD